MESNFFSLPALSCAVETRDSAAMRGFYAEDARLRIIDRDHPPSRPQEIAGRSAIAAYFDDICGRMMTHKIENGIVDGQHLAFTQSCVYPDGTRVFCAAMAELREGRIAKQTIVQAWDA
jgi:SnoaL-like domain